MSERMRTSFIMRFYGIPLSPVCVTKNYAETYGSIWLLRVETDFPDETTLYTEAERNQFQLLTVTEGGISLSVPRRNGRKRPLTVGLRPS